MMILGLDTAATACSVALWSDGRVLGQRSAAMARGQAEALMPMVDDLVTGTPGAAYSGLDAVAVTVGPGAFTGIRIGLAAARGMALAAGIPALGVTTLEAVAHAIPEAERAGRTVLVALDSKRADVYAQAFSQNLAELGPPVAVPLGGLAELLRADPGPVLVAGDAATRVLAALKGSGLEAGESSAPGVADAAIVAEITARRWRPGQAVPPPRPLYLRPPEAKVPAAGGRLRP